MKPVLLRALAIELALLTMASSAAQAKRAPTVLTAPRTEDSSAMPPESLPTLTTAKAAHSLSSDQAKRQYPIHLHAVVTYYDPDTDPKVGAFFACDRTGCICVLTPRRPVLPIRAGTLIDMTGVSAAGIPRTHPHSG